MLRTVLAVVAGVVLWGALWNGGGAGLRALVPGGFGEDKLPRATGALVLLLAFSAVCSVASGYAAAWIASASPMRAVWILAGVNLAIGIAVQAAYWKAFPIGYHLLFLALVVPLHVLGGQLRA